MYVLSEIIYFLAGLFVFGNTCLLVGFVMTIEDKKEEKRKRRIKRKAKAKKKAGAKEKVQTKRKKREVVVVEEDDIIIEEFEDLDDDVWDKE